MKNFFRRIKQADNIHLDNTDEEDDDDDNLTADDDVRTDTLQNYRRTNRRFIDDDAAMKKDMMRIMEMTIITRVSLSRFTLYRNKRWKLLPNYDGKSTNNSNQ